MAELMLVLGFWLTPTLALEALDPYVICLEHGGGECQCEAVRWPWEDPSPICQRVRKR